MARRKILWGLLGVAGWVAGCRQVLGFDADYKRAGNGPSDAADSGADGDALDDASGNQDSEAGTACSGGAQPVGGNGEPCCAPNELACGGHAQKVVLICDPTSHNWTALQSCSGDQLCDTTSGPLQGTCRQPVAACIGKSPGDFVCDGLNAVQCGPDLVTSTEKTCLHLCSDGACVPCQFELVGAADLDNPLAAGDAFVGPNIVATPSGFVISYVEAGATGASSLAVQQLVQDDGTKSVRSVLDLSTFSGNDIQWRGIATAWSPASNVGFLAVSFIEPVGQPTAYIANFDANGWVDPFVGGVRYALPSSITAAPVAGAAADPTSSRHMLAAVANTVPLVYTFDGTAVDNTIGTIDNGGGEATFAQVATSANIVATLADSVPANTTALSVRSPGSSAVSTSFLPGAPFAALTAWADRVFVALPNGDKGSWRVANADGDQVAGGDGAGGHFGSLDATTLNDRVILAGGAPGTITLVRFDNASGVMSGAPSFQSSLSPSLLPFLMFSTLSDYDGGRVAVAAARNRVVVAWLNSTQPVSDTNTAPGGFAVLACDDE